MSKRPSGEIALIEWIRQHVQSAPHVPIGIGDDAALIRNARGPDTLVTTDLLMDGVHFELSSTDPRLIGRKALAVNLSDAAAMAGIPRAAFVSPTRFPAIWRSLVCRGLLCLRKSKGSYRS